MKYLLIDLFNGIILALACYGLLCFLVTIGMIWLFLSMPKEVDDYAGMQASLLGYAEQLMKEGK